MSVELPSGVLVANMLEGMKFALGPTMATRRDVLDSIGGTAALGDYCADDYIFGNFAHARGKRVLLSKHIIRHVAMNTSARTSLAHQVRWMRSTRFSSHVSGDCNWLGRRRRSRVVITLLVVSASRLDGLLRLVRELYGKQHCVAQRTLSIGQGWKDGAFFIFELKARYSMAGLRRRWWEAGVP
jgi:cellulose synthase/poly-beta-1,6-N-acetylglucosamine synthase-like glycosyltransferase